MTRRKAAPPDVGDHVEGSELLRRLALAALNLVHRERTQASRLVKQWLRENDKLLDAVIRPAVNLAVSHAIRNDIRTEREDVLKMSRAIPVVVSGVATGPAVLPPQSACIPIASPAAIARRQARLVKLSGLYGFPLPETGKPLGEAQPWEVKDASLFYGRQRKGMERPERLMALVWEACPDRNLPQSKQRKIRDQVDLETLRRLDRKALEAVELRTLRDGSAA